jgi:hypothetical protein
MLPVGNESLYGGTAATSTRGRVKRISQPVSEIPRFDEIEMTNGSQRETVKIKP